VYADFSSGGLVHQLYTPVIMSVADFCQWLNGLPWSTALSESENAFPLIESAHVLAMSLIAGSILIVDLRVTGLILRTEPVTRVTRTLLPWTWVGFTLMLITGLPLFAAEAMQLQANPAFRLKLVLLGLAGLNALLFHRTVYRSVSRWDHLSTGPLPARVLASASMLLWIAVIVAGRMTAVFHEH
jgi:hypothetical protein